VGFMKSRPVIKDSRIVAICLEPIPQIKKHSSLYDISRFILSMKQSM